MGIFDLFKSNPKETVKKTYHENGNLWSERNFKNGVLHGLEQQYHDNGKILCEQNWNQGKLEGPNNHYDIQGNPILKDNYKDDKLHGECKKYTDGEVSLMQQFYFGTLENEESYFYKNDIQYCRKRNWYC